MKFGINNPSFLQSAGNAGGEIDERFYIKALEDNTEVEFLYPEQTLMSTDGVEYVRATNTTLNTGDKLYMYTDGNIEYSDNGMISVSTGFSAGGKLTLSSLDYGGEICKGGVILEQTSIIDASKVIIDITDGDFCSMINCTSLVNAPQLPATELKDRCYAGMFSGCTSLVNAPQLPATELKKYCYAGMFSGCTSLVNAPQLPATELVEGCYSDMFYGCTSLVNVPDLQATNIKPYTYSPNSSQTGSCCINMFSGCTSLVNAPQLPATELADGCYHGMFSGCTSLVNTPQLPATELKNYCYYGMFSGCTSLVNAPQLPATELKDRCYQGMFRDCTSLTKIVCLGNTNISENTTSYWVSGVSSDGTFVKADGVEWPTGNDGIPDGWTVQDYAG